MYIYIYNQSYINVYTIHIYSHDQIDLCIFWGGTPITVRPHGHSFWTFRLIQSLVFRGEMSSFQCFEWRHKPSGFH